MQMVQEDMDPSEVTVSILSVARTVVNEHVTVSFTATTSEVSSTDGVQEYAREVLSLGLMFLEFKDGIREGDGERVFRCWKILFPLFMSSGRVKYTIEAFTLMCQKEYLLTPRQAMQLLYSRFVNTRGLPHHNIPCDLHMEHLNRTVKTALSFHGGQCQEATVKRVGKNVRCLRQAMTKFDELSLAQQAYGAHARTSDNKNVAKVVNTLASTNVFSHLNRQHHASFPKITCNHLLSQLSYNKVFQWISVHAPLIIR